MKLTRVRIKDFRSFAGEHEFEITTGVNYFVGPNNCGKSNLLRALELALDPDAHYVPERDRPAREPAAGAPPTTRITLTFKVGTSSPEKTLLKRARDYEIGVRRARNAPTTGKIQTYAGVAEVRIATSFGASGARQTTFQAKGFGAASLPADTLEHQRAEEQFRRLVRFGVVHSGEDLESLLKGKFRQILQLVIADHLSEEFAKAEASRSQYLSSLQSELLEPLCHRIRERVGGMFPEITVARLVPGVPTVAETLSSVDVQLGDAVTTTALTDKGTGVRGAVLVSMLQYLAEQSKRSLVMAVEEPEAFLHPAGQEAIRSQLEDLAARADVSLLVTTHSPYVISRANDASITELHKSADGVTSKAASVAGDESRAELLGSLYRDAGLARVLERSLEVPAGTRAVLVTEGYTDGLFLTLCCRAVGRADLLDGLHIIAAGKAAKVVVLAVLAEAATEAPVIALLDSDENGRAAVDKLKSFGWEPSKRILSLKSWPGACANHDVEIEDLLPKAAVERVIAKVGEDASIDVKIKCNRSWHLQLSTAWKEQAIASFGESLTSNDGGGMIWLAEEIQHRAGKIAAAKSKAATARAVAAQLASTTSSPAT
jgi:putative ATP-dependent endonuclease of OLD family